MQNNSENGEQWQEIGIYRGGAELTFHVPVVALSLTAHTAVTIHTLEVCSVFHSCSTCHSWGMEPLMLFTPWHSPCSGFFSDQIHAIITSACGLSWIHHVRWKLARVNAERSQCSHIKYVSEKLENQKWKSKGYEWMNKWMNARMNVKWMFVWRNERRKEGWK